MDSFARPPAVRCRGGARPSRRNAADPHGLPIKTCRRNWCAPFSRRPVRIVCAVPGEACLAPTMAGVGRQCLPEIATSAYCLLAMTNLWRLPFNDSLFLAPVQRRAGPSPPLQGACGRRGHSVILGCAWRSLSAATDVIGAYHFNGGLYKLRVPSRDCTPRALPRASRSGRHGPVGASQ